MFDVHTANLNVGPIPDIQRRIAPKLAAHRDEVIQNRALFARIDALTSAVTNAGTDAVAAADDDLSGPQRRLLEDHHRRFVRNGARLDDGAKARLSSINQELAGLFTDFTQNVLADEDEIVTWIDDADRLGGLPGSFVDSLAAAAAERGRPDRWAVLNTRASMDPFLTYADDRALREEVWRAFYGRGDRPGEHDNKPIITQILRLRAERARLLGYDHHAHWRLEESMARTPEAAIELMERVWTRAVARAREEIADLQALADADGAGLTIEPWDHRYYAEKVRKERFDLDFNEVTPYLRLEKLIEAMLWCSSELYGLVWTPIEPPDRIPVFHPDVRVWEVTRTDGGLVGLWYLDPYARQGKVSGAWMTEYRPQDALDGPTPTLVSNNSNFIKGAEGEPVLISWDDARTLFHEFGHALHGLLSDVVYPSQAGTAVPRDYVEFPSQINEHWLSTPEVLQRFCRHVETDEPMPAHLIERIERAGRFNQGFDTVEYLACALLDMELHRLDVDDLAALEGGGLDPSRFEREALERIGMPNEIPMRHRLPHFAHVFATDGYSAGYYSYLWADMLTADAAEAFEQAAGGYFDREVAERLQANVLSAGDTIDPADGYVAFRGRPADPDALLRKRGLPV